MLTGKGMYIWQIKNCERGDPELIAARAKGAGLSHCLIKVADGIHHVNLIGANDLVWPLVVALHRQGIQAWGWHYVYGNDPVNEAKVAIDSIAWLGLDGFVVDAEVEYKAPGKTVAAEKYMAPIRARFPHLPLALSSYRFPTLHRDFPFVNFLKYCDLNMPQVYWLFASNAGSQLSRSVAEFNALTVKRPIIPTGAAWRQGGWAATPAHIADFLSTAERLGLQAANFWEWWRSRTDIPQVWDAIASYPFAGCVPAGESNADPGRDQVVYPKPAGNSAGGGQSPSKYQLRKFAAAALRARRRQRG